MTRASGSLCNSEMRKFPHLFDPFLFSYNYTERISVIRGESIKSLTSGIFSVPEKSQKDENRFISMTFPLLPSPGEELFFRFDAACSRVSASFSHIIKKRKESNSVMFY